jgi:pilus assembly protein CpaB
MRAHQILLIVAGVALLGAGGLIVQAFLRVPQLVRTLPHMAAVPMRAILVARTDLSGGTFLQESDFAWKDRPAAALRPDFYLEGEDSTAVLNGSVLLRPLHAGEAILRDDVVSPSQRGFLAALLPPGKRSVSVAVDEVTDDAGLIFPGDYVDVILTHTDAEATLASHQVLGETILQDLRVLAVDQTLHGPTEEGDPVPAGAATQPKGVGVVSGPVRPTAQANQQRGVARTVTLEVTSHEAAILAVAANLGKITLALRSLAGDTPAQPAAASTVVWAGDVMRSLGEMDKVPEAKEDIAASSVGVILLRGGGSGK